MVAPVNSLYIQLKALSGDKADNIPSLLSTKKAMACAMNLDLFRKFMSVEENRANFSINKKLIEFANVPLEDIIFNEVLELIKNSNYEKI
jgi:hypothetical protein